MSFDRRDILFVLRAGLGSIPYFGNLINQLLTWLWPQSGQEVWDEIKEKVEKLIEQDISAEVYNRIKAQLKGLRSVLKNYEQAVRDGGSDKALITAAYTAAKDFFDAAIPSFKEKGYETLLLPLLIPVVDMKLGLLRDALVHGKSWGLPDKYIADQHADLKSTISENARWADDWFRYGYGRFGDPQDYYTDMTVSVRDHVFYWNDFDPAVNPGGLESAILIPKRELFLGGVGYTDPLQRKFHLHNVYNYQWNKQRSRLTGVRIWDDGHGLKTIQVSNGGVWRKQDGVPHSGAPRWETANDVANPIVRVTGTSDRWKSQSQKFLVKTIQFHFADGSKSDAFGGKAGKVSFDWSLSGHVVRNLYMDDEVRGLMAGFCFPDVVYDAAAPIVPIEFKNWQDTGASGTGLRDAIESALRGNARLVWPSEVVAAWKNAGLNSLAYAMLADSSIAQPLQEDSGKFHKGPNIDSIGGNQGYFHTPLKDVSFHQQSGLSKTEAEKLCAEKGWRLATIYEVEAAWQYRDLNVGSWGRLWDGRFAIALQKAQGGTPRGVLLSVPPKANEGFFYVLDTKT